MNCEHFEVLLGERLDGHIDTDDRIAMDAHAAECAECRALLHDVSMLVADARALPQLTPSRDLWSGIAAQLGEQEHADEPLVVARTAASNSSVASHAAATVHSLDAHRASRASHVARGAARWTPSPRMLAAAAMLLVAVTAGVTWNLARQGLPAAGGPLVAVPPSTDTMVDRVATGDPVAEAVRAGLVPPSTSGVSMRGADSTDARWADLESRYVANSEADVDAMYEREIAALREIVDERFAELDSTTVAEVRKNLGIIDKAIRDSRAALQRDPRSQLLSRQLDRALEHKLELMRRVALL